MSHVVNQDFIVIEVSGRRYDSVKPHLCVEQVELYGIPFPLIWPVIPVEICDQIVEVRDLLTERQLPEGGQDDAECQQQPNGTHESSFVRNVVSVRIPQELSPSGKRAIPAVSFVRRLLA